MARRQRPSIVPCRTYVILVTVLFLVNMQTGNGLTCLQCDGVPQPRFCSRVVECYEGEFCGAMKVENEFGEHVFNLGCHTKKVCDNFTSSAKSCSECCGTNLCNADVCGEPGYPTNRGPICFNCPVHTSSGPCHDIDFCLEDEACSIVGRQLFSSEVLTSKCVSKHVCKSNPEHHVSIIGKRDVSLVKRTQQHTCDLCCSRDLCNRNCSTATSGLDNVDCTAQPCGSGGTCYNGDHGYTCICALGYSGRNCEINIDDCIPGLCANHGTCVDGVNSYSCMCAPGFNGSNCLTNIDDCTAHPCGSGGTCYDGDNSYTCICAPGYSGRNCEIDVDDCIPGLCGNNGTCVDGVNSYTCMCAPGFTGTNCQTSTFTTDCYDLRNQEKITQDGVYSIRTWKTNRQIKVFCDMTTSGGGWTVFQNRFNGSVEFNRNFSEYVNGFGDMSSEFWLGLENVYEMAAQGRSELRIDLSTANGTKGYEVFQNFSISAGSSYKLHISIGTGSIGDSTAIGLSFNNGCSFSTTDHDRDLGSNQNCAENTMGPWWHCYCTNINLNGKYCSPGSSDAMHCMKYRAFTPSENKSLKTSRMMFRRI